MEVELLPSYEEVKNRNVEHETSIDRIALSLIPQHTACSFCDLSEFATWIETDEGVQCTLAHNLVESRRGVGASESPYRGNKALVDEETSKLADQYNRKYFSLVQHVHCHYLNFPVLMRILGEEEGEPKSPREQVLKQKLTRWSMEHKKGGWEEEEVAHNAYTLCMSIGESAQLDELLSVCGKCKKSEPCFRVPKADKTISFERVVLDCAVVLKEERMFHLSHSEAKDMIVNILRMSKYWRDRERQMLRQGESLIENIIRDKGENEAMVLGFTSQMQNMLRGRVWLWFLEDIIYKSQDTLFGGGCDDADRERRFVQRCEELKSQHIGDTCNDVYLAYLFASWLENGQHMRREVYEKQLPGSADHHKKRRTTLNWMTVCELKVDTLSKIDHYSMEYVQSRINLGGGKRLTTNGRRRNAASHGMNCLTTSTQREAVLTTIDKGTQTKTRTVCVWTSSARCLDAAKSSGFLISNKSNIPYLTPTCIANLAQRVEPNDSCKPSSHNGHRRMASVTYQQDEGRRAAAIRKVNQKIFKKSGKIAFFLEEEEDLQTKEDERKIREARKKYLSVSRTREALREDREQRVQQWDLTFSDRSPPFPPFIPRDDPDDDVPSERLAAARDRMIDLNKQGLLKGEPPLFKYVPSKFMTFNEFVQMDSEAERWVAANHQVWKEKKQRHVAISFGKTSAASKVQLQEWANHDVFAPDLEAKSGNSKFTNTCVVAFNTMLCRQVALQADDLGTFNLTGTTKSSSFKLLSEVDLPHPFEERKKEEEDH